MFNHFRTADELMSQQEPDDLPIQTDSPCPFCGQWVEWNGDQLYCEPCSRVWPDFAELTFDGWVAKAKARKAAHVAAEEAVMWAYYEEDDQRDEDSSGYADAVAEGLERWTR